MSRKDVEDYYNKITRDYQEMVETLKDMEELAAQKVVSPEQIDNIKQMVEPLKNNYQRISYIIFLLNQPTRKSKVEAYKRREKKFLSKCDLSEHEENQRVIQEMNSVWGRKE